MRTIHRLDITWSTSRGRDTYGYNICRLDDSVQHKRYRCMGGGYDMVGTVLGDWFEDAHQACLQKLFADNVANLVPYGAPEQLALAQIKKLPGYYGATLNEHNGRVSLDGACGVESIRKIIEACGFEFEASYSKKGETRAFYVQSK